MTRRPLRNRLFGKKEIEPPLLFKGYSSLFEESLASAEVYFEYGVGQSTLWVDANSHARVIAVDSSTEWIDQVSEQLNRDDIELHHVDIGELIKWGRPKSYERRERFIDYVEGPWRFGSDPDVVLIDGRFRVACFLTCLMHASPGCRIIFDDYSHRFHYHIVETILKRNRDDGRQALFIVPDDLPPKDEITALRNQFLMVMD